MGFGNNINKTLNVEVKKHVINITTYKIARKVEITFSEENCPISFLFKDEFGFKWNSKIKGFSLRLNEKNMAKINEAFACAIANEEDFYSYYKVNNEVAVEENITVDIFGELEIQQVKEERKEERKKNKEEKAAKKDYSYGDVEDNVLYEKINDNRNKVSEHWQRKAKQINNNVITLEEQSDTYKESIESRMAELLKAHSYIDKNGNILRFKDYYFNSYSLMTEDECVNFIKMKTKEAGLEKFVTNTAAKNIYSAMVIDSVNEYDTNRYKNFSERHFSIMVNQNGRDVNVMLSIEVDIKTKRPFVKLVSPNDVEFCKYRIAAVKLDINKIVDKDGNKVEEIDFKNNEFLEYVPKFDENCELNKYLFEPMYDTDEMKEAAQIIEGSFLTHTNLQRALFYVGHGGDGKSFRQRIYNETYYGLFFDKADISMEDLGGFNNFNGYRFPIWGVPESKNNDGKKQPINFTYFKKLVGKDPVEFKIKHRNESISYRFLKLSLIANANYNALPTISSDDLAIIRRMTFIKINKSKRSEDNLDNLLLNGGQLNNEAFSDEIIEFKGTATQDMFEFHLEGALKLEAMRGFSMDKLGQSVLNFQNEMIERMSNGADFFEYNGIVENEEFGILADDILEQFKIFKGNQNYNKKKFYEEIRSVFRKKFGKEVISEDVMVRSVDEYGNTCKRRSKVFFIDFTGLVGVFNKHKRDDKITENIVAFNKNKGEVSEAIVKKDVVVETKAVRSKKSIL